MISLFLVSSPINLSLLSSLPCFSLTGLWFKLYLLRSKPTTIPVDSKPLFFLGSGPVCEKVQEAGGTVSTGRGLAESRVEWSYYKAICSILYFILSGGYSHSQLLLTVKIKNKVDFLRHSYSWLRKEQSCKNWIIISRSLLPTTLSLDIFSINLQLWIM